MYFFGSFKKKKKLDLHLSIQWKSIGAHYLLYTHTLTASLAHSSMSFNPCFETCSSKIVLRRLMTAGQLTANEHISPISSN